MLRKYRKWITIAAILLTIFIGFQYISNILAYYPTTTISKEKLLDEDRNFFKEFELDEEGNLVSQSIDPWLEYYFDEPLLVEEVNIILNSISEENTWGQIYNMDTEEWIPCYLHNGENALELPEEWRKAPIVKGLRFDFTTVEDVVIDLNKVVLNDYSLFRKELARQVIAVLCSVLLLLLTIYTWTDFVVYKGNWKYWIGGGIAIALQMTACIVFGIRYFIEKRHGMILEWYLILFFALMLLEQLAIRSRMTGNKGKRSDSGSIRILEITEDSPKEKRQQLLGKVVNSLLLLLMLLLASLVEFAVMEILSGVQFDLENWTNTVCNLALYFEINLIVYLMIRRLGIAVVTANVLILILALVNHYYFQFRGEPFELSSIIMADTALSVLDNYKLTVNESLWYVIIAEALFLNVTITVLCRKEINFPKKVKFALLVPTIVLGIVVYNNPPTVNYWSITDTSRTEGYLYSFMGYLKESGKIDKPEGYSAGNAENVLKKYVTQEEGNTPDVIVIMNEAFADLPSIYDFETDEALLPFISSLQENTIKGSCLVSVFGGTTCNSEYEFLTGNSLAFFPGGSVPYMQYVQEKQQSLAHLLKNRNYTVSGYHAYFKGGFHRDLIYPLLGIDTFYGWEDEFLPGTDVFRYFLSDKANYNNVTYLYEENESDSPQFIFNVTMQNHGGYSDTESAVEVTVQPTQEDMQTPQLQEYLSLVRESDDAFRQLVEYYENVEKDTIILMFGDHQPGLGTESYDLMDSRLYAENATLEEKQKQYLSTFVIWANFDIEEQEDMLISANYLRSFLLETAGMKLSAYDNFLVKLREKYPAVNAFGYCDIEGNWYEIEEADDVLLQQYAWLNYYNVFDKKALQEKYYVK